MPHKEFFRKSHRSGQKLCQHCRSEIRGEEFVWSWVAVMAGFCQWTLIHEVCRACWPETRKRIAADAADYSRTVELAGWNNVRVPDWITMEKATPALTLVGKR